MASADALTQQVRVVRPAFRIRRAVRFLAGSLAALCLVGLVGGLWLRSEVRASVARYDGTAIMDGLKGVVQVERDALGVPTVRGGTLEDVVRATGFVHAQERFFQMDLLRRQSAGELAAILGRSAAASDRNNRLHRLRSHAQAAFDALEPSRRALLEAYAAGVNAGMRNLGAVPPEYLLLRTTPAPWRPEDSLLVILTMYLRLQDPTGRLDATLGTLFNALPRDLAEFLAPRGTPWEAPITGEPFKVAPMPGPAVLDLRSGRHPVPRAAELLELDSPIPGSNSWAVAGMHAAGGGALLANDMHLGLGMPNIWYRLSQVWVLQGEERRVTGVSLPGVPFVLAGSNGRIAWGLTNSQGDWTDLVNLQVDPKDKSRYLTPQGWQSFVEHVETIDIRGADPERFSVRDTIWGPVVDVDKSGRPRAARWVAHLLGSVDLGIMDLIDANTVDQAIAVAHRTGVPAQNFVVADRDGRIGWTIIGRVPRRFGTDGRIPTSWADGTAGWDGWLDPDSVPSVVDPSAGRVWTANARVVSGDMLRTLGDGGYDLGARARQIRDRLMEIDQATPRAMLDIQLDDRALFLSPWRRLMLEVFSSHHPSGRPRIDELVRRVRDDWSGRASIDSVAYRIVRGWRTQVARRVMAPLVAACTEENPQFDYFRIGGRFEGPLWRLVTERPTHLLDPRYRSWDELFLDAAEGLVEERAQSSANGSLETYTWGARNSVLLRHPLGRSLPLLGSWLDVPVGPLPGDSNMPRVQDADFGASERFVVSPGHEDEGIFEMPAGQSGHFSSPYYTAGNDAWVEGRPGAFLPGAKKHNLTLTPQ
jgi:penicillin G amidase